MHASFKALPRKILSIEEYLAAKGRSSKPVLTLVAPTVPSKATLAKIERGIAARLNSPLAMANDDLY